MMERLTARNQKGLAYLVNVKPNEQEVESPYKNTLQCILDAFERLAQYEDAKEEGRLVELPCKVGSKVYEPETDESARVDSVEIYFHTHMGAYTLDDFGETVFVFLTREEAEQALREQAID